jgi:hypothetical protein
MCCPAEAQQPGKPKPPDNPPRRPEPGKPEPVEEPPEPIPVPPKSDEPTPMDVSLRIQRQCGRENHVNVWPRCHALAMFVRHASRAQRRGERRS